jgi:hypothetical protein
MEERSGGVDLDLRSGAELPTGSTPKVRDLDAEQVQEKFALNSGTKPSCRRGARSVNEASASKGARPRSRTAMTISLAHGPGKSRISGVDAQNDSGTRRSRTATAGGCAVQAQAPKAVAETAMRVNEGDKSRALACTDSSSSPRALVRVEFEATNTRAAPSQGSRRTHTVLVDPRTKPAI